MNFSNPALTLEHVGSHSFLLIAGPCSLENQAVCQAVATVLRRIADKHSDVCVVFKGSFDKANRTALSGKRGPGRTQGLELLAWVKKTYQLPVTTDVHAVEDCQALAAVCDVLQIPAFLCRQTDLLVAAAETGRMVNVKKGQFLAPDDMAFVVEKLKASQAKGIWQTERGSTFGYHNLVVDMRSFPIMKQWGTPVLFDATHSVQLPSAAGGQSGGQREFIPTLASAAIAAGIDGLFVETHPNPAEALSDAQTQLPLDQFEPLLERWLGLWRWLRDNGR